MVAANTVGSPGELPESKGGTAFYTRKADEAVSGKIYGGSRWWRRRRRRWRSDRRKPWGTAFRPGAAAVREAAEAGRPPGARGTVVLLRQTKETRAAIRQAGNPGG